MLLLLHLFFLSLGFRSQCDNWWRITTLSILFPIMLALEQLFELLLGQHEHIHQTHLLVHFVGDLLSLELRFLS